MAYRQNRYYGPDNLLLPRSWILRALTGPLGVPTQDPDLTVLVEAVGKLLRKLFISPTFGQCARYSCVSMANESLRFLSS